MIQGVKSFFKIRIDERTKSMRDSIQLAKNAVNTFFALPCGYRHFAFTFRSAYKTHQHRSTPSVLAFCDENRPEVTKRIASLKLAIRKVLLDAARSPAGEDPLLRRSIPRRVYKIHQTRRHAPGLVFCDPTGNRTPVLSVRGIRPSR